MELLWRQKPWNVMPYVELLTFLWHVFRYLQTPGINLNAQLCPENTEKFSELRECLKFIGFTSDVSLCSIYPIIHTNLS